MKHFACLLLVCLAAGYSGAFSLTSTLSKLQNIKEKADEVISKLGDDVKDAQESFKEFFKNIADTQNTCQKDGNSLQCCAKDLLKDDVCINLAVDPADFSLGMSVQMKGKTLINETISGKNPDPICVPLPNVPLLKLCIEPYDLSIVSNQFNACLALSLRLMNKDTTRVDLQCMQFETNGDVSFLLAPEESTANAMFNIDASAFNPLMNTTVNPVELISQLF